MICCLCSAFSCQSRKKHLEGKFGVGRCVDLVNRRADSHCGKIVELEESPSNQVTLLSVVSMTLKVYNLITDINPQVSRIVCFKKFKMSGLKCNKVIAMCCLVKSIVKL